MLEQVLVPLLASIVGGIFAGGVTFGAIRAELNAQRRDLDRHEALFTSLIQRKAHG